MLDLGDCGIDGGSTEGLRASVCSAVRKWNLRVSGSEGRQIKRSWIRIDSKGLVVEACLVAKVLTASEGCRCRCPVYRIVNLISSPRMNQGSEFAIREEDLNLRLDFRVSIRVMLRMGT